MARKTKKIDKFPPKFLVVLILLLLLPLLVFQVGKQQLFRQFAQETVRPNIIVIMTDDQRWDEMETLPTVTGRLANNGVTFTNAYVTTPLCCPSRASFLTGLYAHNTGVWKNIGTNGGFAAFESKEQRTIAVWLRDAGYRTGVFGKFMNGYQDASHISPGWDTWFVAVSGQRYFGQTMSDNGTFKTYPSDAYFTDIIKEEALTFISETSEPFFLLFTPNIPHYDGEEAEETDVPEELDPPALPPGYAEENCTDISPWQKPPSFNEGNVIDKPMWVQKLKGKGPSGVEVANFRKGQLCALKIVDQVIQEMIMTLEDQGRMENTVFIFFSDNGYSLGEHHYVKKNCLYEECARTPLIISYPKLIPQRVTNTSLVSHIDITATIADVAGVSIPVPVNGKSLVPILTGQTQKVRSEVLIEVYPQDTRPRGSAIRTPSYKYTEYATGEKELYDLEKDPYELTNIVNKPDMKFRVKNLSERLNVLKKE